ncbi:TetR/AcrR family transcriptional regulator [Fodinicola acaciae]|uniref:TetR/AcrR family transcriptional regulator n=1 Tax=Fodinicola acaciae TaxID=2681555 RepID=UPI0013D4591F|nr:TetR/AcrR family transcriptional regulator [Fodinicola acaciae]
MRADARRNRLRVLRAAEEVFAVQGIAVPLDEIARRAGVGAGTVYRHFPTKEALFEAVVGERLEQLLGDATSLLSAEDAGAAFFEFFAMKVEQASLNKALSDAIELSCGAGGRRDQPDTVHTLWVLMGQLLRRAQQAGAVRADLDPDDVRALMVGCVRAQDQLEREKANHIVDVLTDGMRPPR